MKILIMRMMGLGDVAAILIPAVKIIHQQYPQSDLHVLTFGAGVELMSLVPEVSVVLAVVPEQWPGDIGQAVPSFMEIAEIVLAQGYDLVINLDTWFMPCFLAQILKEAGLNLQGNYINLSIDSLFHQIRGGTLTQVYFQAQQLYLQSSYSNMADWSVPWWNRYPQTTYPEFYLQHCCGFNETVDISLAVEADLAFKQRAGAKRIVALSLFGSKASKQYHHGEVLRSQLEQAGFYVWSQFDGSVNMQTTLGRLKVTDLLVTVATSTQWLAKLVACPSLMIPGALPPSVLGAEAVVDKVLGCQYCHQNQCVENLNFACMDISPELIAVKVRQYFDSH